jgi:two-component system heavy metal sensor histidine kinase CusS
MILLFCAVVATLLALTYVAVYETFSNQTRVYLDDRLSDSARFLAMQLANQPAGTPFSATGSPGQLLEMILENGASSGNSTQLYGAATNADPLPIDGKTTLRTLPLNGRTVRVAVVPFRFGSQRAWLLLGESTAGVERIESAFLQRAVAFWACSLILTTIIAGWYVSRSLAPLVALNKHARRLTDQASSAAKLDLGGRLPVTNPRDELGQLALSFNELFEKLDAAARQLRQFVSDAAHELRTPLAVLHGTTQLLLSQRRSVDEYESRLASISTELTGMVRIVEGLFTLSMADAGQLRLHRERLQLDEIFEEACGIAAPIARKKEIRIEQADCAAVALWGDGTLVREALLILLENAIKYSPERTVISTGIRVGEPIIEVYVRDQGIGIAPEKIPLIFKRFYRAAPQPSDDSRSGGLGLSIAEAIMRAHEGQIVCTSVPGEGSFFALVFTRQDLREPEETTQGTSAPPPSVSGHR